MKFRSGHIVVGLAVVILVAGLSRAFLAERETALTESQPAVQKPTSSGGVIHVDELAENPESYQGAITIRAVIAKVNPEQGVVAVIDSREFEQCGQLNCAKHYVPVKIAGELPEPKSLLLITGKIVRDKQGMVFQSTKVESAK